MKENLMLGGMYALVVVLFPLGILIVLCLSYGMLAGVNYLIPYIPIDDLHPFDIQLTHILLGAIFFAVIFKSDSQSNKEIENLKRSICIDLNSIGYKVDQIVANVTELEDISRSLVSIDRGIDDIRCAGDRRVGD